MQQTNDLETLTLIDKPDDSTVIAVNPAGGLVTIELREGSVVRTVGGTEELLYAGNEKVAAKVFESIADLLAKRGKPAQGTTAVTDHGPEIPQASPKPASPLARDPEPGKGVSATTLVLGMGLALILGVGATVAVVAPDIGSQIMNGRPTTVLRTVTPDETAPAATSPAEDGQTVEERNAAIGVVAPEEPDVAPPQPVVDLPTTMRTEAPAEVETPTDAVGPQAALEMIRAATDEAQGTAESGATPAVPAPIAPAAPAEPETVPAEETPMDAPQTLGERAVEAAEQFEATQEEATRSVNEVGTEKAATELELMKQALAILSAGDKITPEQAEGLPHDLATRLRAAGAIQTLEEAAAIAGPEATYSIIRLPANVVDSHRDSDGVQTIPQENSWAARGGVVSVPLPGGGDITSPLDLEAFGLEP